MHDTHVFNEVFQCSMTTSAMGYGALLAILWRPCTIIEEASTFMKLVMWVDGCGWIRRGEGGVMGLPRRMRVRAALAVAGFAMAALPLELHAAALREVMVYPTDQQTRLVFGFTAPVRMRVLTLGSPPRLVIDVPAVTWRKSLQDQDSAGLMEGLRYGRLPNGGLRMVIDLPAGVRHNVRSVQRGTMVVADLVPRPGQRVVATRSQRRTLRRDVMGTLGDAAPRQAAASRSSASAARTAASAAGSLRRPSSPASRAVAPQPFIVAIDAGHGGKDPGAIGPRGTQEKRVTLAIARALAQAIDTLPGMKAVLTRSDDRFIKLRQRVAIARAKHADCFISIHADSVPNSKALGSSVYVVSAKGASSEAAKWLAAKENAADLAGGVSLGDQEPDVASVLLDISQSGALAGAQALAQAVLAALDDTGAMMHRTAVQRAPFAVLKAPDMPSILVETAFISNPQEERLLRSATYQKTLAHAIRDGLLGYVAANPPADGRRWHVARRGDTMAALASNYGVGLGTVAAANGRRLDDGTVILPGEVLFIPGSS